MNENISPKTLVPFGSKGVELTSMEDAFRFAVAVSKSGFAPKGIESPEAIMIAVQFGAELGLTPMASLQSLAIVNGRPSVFGDAALALVRSSGYLESYTQATSGEGDNLKATVTVKRKDEQAITAEFSVADAKKAQLWGKAGPWTQYPARMLMFRARGFALRDAFGDVLRGLATVEENLDLPDERIKAAKVVLPKIKEANSLSQLTVSENAAAVTEPVPATILEPTLEAQAPSMILARLIEKSGFNFIDLVPVLHSSRLCARNAQNVDDLTEANTQKIISDFDIIISATKSEKAS